MIVSNPAPGWCRIIDLTIVDQIGYSLGSAAAIARKQRWKELPVITPEE